ncbi:MAG: RagB/SusD family nutrient uptake outer membrane protein [Bacteroidales bacterium]|nr:RagB/SusD family nutrient uptake outer membrane protein [Bacteroidales bacterium]
MKSIINKIIIAGMAAAVSYSCTNLDETLYSNISSETHEFTEQELAATIAPVYSKLRDVCWGWFGSFDLNDMSSDVWGVPNRIGIGWGDLYIPFHKHQFNSELGFIEVSWDENYGGINACNKALANEAIANNKATAAQIRAFRVLYYYNLFSAFRNIPLDLSFDHEDGWLPEQSKSEDTFNWMVTELQEIADDCPEDAELGKMSKYAAHMILAKLYLNHNAWFKDDSDKSWYQKALDEIDIVISGPFSLAPTYDANFKQSIAGNKEIIFGLPFEEKYAGGNYYANLWHHTAIRQRWGFSGWATNGGIVFPQFLDIYEKGDKRFDLTWTGGPQFAADGSPIMVDGKQAEYTREIRSIDNPGCYPFEGYALIKYEIVSGPRGTSYDDVAYFRLAEAYYIKAECLLRLNKNLDEAAELVTAVRQRAFSNPEDAKITAEQLMGGSRYDYGHRENTAEVNQPDNWIITHEGGADIELGGLLDEYAIEFVAEQHRRDCLIRFNIKGSDMNVYCGKSWFCKDAEPDRHSDIFPIPKFAMDGNPKLKQNPGYDGVPVQ